MGLGGAADGGPRTKGELFWNEKLVDNTPTYAEGYQSGTRLGRWELRTSKGRNSISNSR